MLLLGQAGADRGVFAPDGCIASDTFQPDPQIFHIYQWTDPHGHQVTVFCSMTKTKTELVRTEDSPVVPVLLTAYIPGIEANKDSISLMLIS